MEEIAQRIRRLACNLCPGKPLGKKRSSASSIPAFAAVGYYPGPSKCGEPGFHLHQGSSRWNGCFKKSGPQSIGRTRGGWNTKLHMVAASDRDGVAFALSAGNCGDAPEGRALCRLFYTVNRIKILPAGNRRNMENPYKLHNSMLYYVILLREGVINAKDFSR